jgi:hypothetical protein
VERQCLQEDTGVETGAPKVDKLCEGTDQTPLSKRDSVIINGSTKLIFADDWRIIRKWMYCSAHFPGETLGRAKESRAVLHSPPEVCRLLGCGAVSQKTAFFVVTAVKTSKL